MWIVVLGCGMGPGPSSAAPLDFGRDVRPILSDHCYTCHGPDAAQRDSALRLDQQESAFADLGGYAAIVPGKPEESELVRRITADDADMQMPPLDHPKQLTAEEKEKLVEWIRQGAPWQGHWAFETPVRAELPDVKNSQQCMNFIDHWISSALEERGWTFSEVADRRTLIRRLSFDLTGLPPDPKAVEAFVREPSERAYEDLVDTLLASPHFGERMAVYWLDLVRYADTVGYHGDQPVSISPYRDYVINAFNANVPFDTFTREQLAGDLLEGAGQRQKIASGYNRLGMMSAEGGVQPREYLAKYAADRVRTTASVWLGVTLGCAECHDHKYDPFASADFYRFAAFFADIKEKGLYSGADATNQWGPMIEVQDPYLPQLIEPIDAELQRLRAELDRDTPQLRASQRVWEAELRDAAATWSQVTPVKVHASGDVVLTVQDDGSLLASGANPPQSVYVATIHTGERPVRGLRLEALPHASLPQNGPGRAGNGNFVVSELTVLRGDHTARLAELQSTVDTWPEDLRQFQLPLDRAVASIEQAPTPRNSPYKAWSAASAIDGDLRGTGWGWAILPEVGRAQELVVHVQPHDANNSGIASDDVLTVVIHQHHENPTHTLGRFRLSLSDAEQPNLSPLRTLPESVKDIVLADPQGRSAQQQEELARYYRQVAPETRSLREELAKLEKQREELVQAHTRTTLVTVSVAPRTMRVLHRGNWMDESGPVVEPGVPSCFRQLTTPARPTRLDLANWIVAPDNPLTARVFVNRLWRMYFGVGLSRVLDDLGAQGESPTHPELLDALAVEFVESGWDVKHMIKLMVMSRTYRQSSMVTDELRQADPYNRYLARQSRFRLDAEFIRDNALSVSGLLVRRVGGASAKPYQPAGLYRHLNFPKREYVADTDENQYRRGVYTHWQRQYLHPAMKTFDAPAREECTAERPRSNTPLGALVLLNDPTYVEAARELATNILREHHSDAARTEGMFQRALNRVPSEQEASVILQLVEKQRAYFAEHTDQATALLEVGLAPVPSEMDRAELAAWTTAARAVFNMYEFVARY